MQTSADRRRQAGFTLLEVMATVGLVGLVLLPILQVREQASHRAYQTSHMMRGLNYAQTLLSQQTRSLDELDEWEGRIEDEPAFRYVVTLEDWDLATGRSESEGDEDDLFNDPSGAIPPSDAATTLEDLTDDPHLVRRFHIEVFWPSLDAGDAEAEDSVVLEGFLPRIWEEEDTLGFNR
jgi:prepilin-type N-terminal cleavage/methylation domain-containing protein